ncbi:hypothetical protein BE11_45520 [Sorangium cellulosum]|nr:hypothetical protein BE11_45520 [Sorangium cellulosum]
MTESSPRQATWREIAAFERGVLTHSRAQLLGWLGMLIAASIVTVAPPLLVGKLVDEALPAHHLRLGVALAAAIALAVLAREGAKASALYFLETLIVEGMFQRRRAIFEAIQRKEIKALRTLGADDVYQRMTEGTTKILEAMQLFFGEFLFYVIASVVGLWVVVRVDPIILALLLAIYVPYILARKYILFARMGHLFGIHIPKQAGIIQAVREALEGIRLVKTTDAAHVEVARLEERQGVYMTALRGHIRAMSVGVFLNQMMFLLPEGIVYLYLGNKVLDGTATIGQLLVVIGLFPQFRQLVWHLSRMSFHRQEHGQHIQRINEVLALPDEGYTLGRFNAPIRGELSFQGISFSYGPNSPILTDFSLTIRPGESIGVVGISGAGKSTLASLIVGLEVPDSGRICIDDVPIDVWDMAGLRKQIAYISQDIYMVNGTIRQNLEYGLGETRVEELDEALRAADLEGLVASLPEGLDTVIGERGLQLSGGQRQRLSIARAYLRQPRVLLFDETTASLDLESEARVQAAQARLQGDRTTLVIAHRLVTLQGMDRIVVLQDGRITEVGSHRELMQRGGHYASLYQEQWTPGELKASAAT